MTPIDRSAPDELGAHVSAAGGADKAPARAAAIGARVMQIFARQPNRWTGPALADGAAEAHRRERARLGIAFAASHDSYLINLASPKPALWERSLDAFQEELARAARLGLDAVVTHPGNATDGDREGGIRRNARAVALALERVPAAPKVLLELTAGAGTSVGGGFEELGRILRLLPPESRDRVGVCLDTCHAWVAGMDLRRDAEGVWARADDAFGADRIELLHLNDARAPLGSRLDRHEHIGLGAIGIEAFRWIMNAPALRDTPKVIETPKGDDGESWDRRNLRLLRSLRES